MDGFELLFYYDLDDGADAPTPQGSGAEIGRLFGTSAARFLGAGSFGETWYLPADAAGNSERAVKIIMNPLYPAKRIEAEISGLQRVSHANVVGFVDHVTVSLAIGPREALVFDYVDGGDLSSKLAIETIPVAAVLPFAIAMLGAVEAMHAAGTVHRDIKPENIALRGGEVGDPVLLDLGLARLLDAETMTLYPAPMGTCPFMAPEQVRLERASKQADVWALGVVLYIMLTGRHPFFGPRTAAKTSEEALAAYQAGPPPLPTAVPADLAESVMTMLSYEPHVRGSARRHHRRLSNPLEGRP